MLPERLFVKVRSGSLGEPIDRVALISVLVGSLFLSTFTLYSRLADFSPDIVLSSPRRAPGIAQMAAIFPQSLGLFLLWLGPFQVILWGISAWGFIRDVIQRERRNDDLLHLCAIVITLGYAALGFAPWYYPRYQAPIVPILTILIAGALVDAITRLRRRHKPISLWLALYGGLAGIVQYVVVGDPLRPVYDALYFSTDPELAHRLGQGLIAAIGLVWLVPVAGGAGFVVARWLRVDIGEALKGVLGAMMIALIAATMLRQVTTHYSTRYLYGQEYEDLRQAVDVVQTRTTATDTIMAPKSVWYYAHARGAYIEAFVCPGCDPASFLSVLRTVKPEVVVWATQLANPSPQVANDAAVRTLLGECYAKEIRGDFSIYLRDHARACSQ